MAMLRQDQNRSRFSIPLQYLPFVTEDQDAQKLQPEQLPHQPHNDK